MCMECITIAGALLIVVRHPSQIVVLWDAIRSYFRA